MKPPLPRPKPPDTRILEQNIRKPWQDTPKREKCPRNGLKWSSLYIKINEKEVGISATE